MVEQEKRAGSREKVGSKEKAGSKEKGERSDGTNNGPARGPDGRELGFAPKGRKMSVVVTPMSITLDKDGGKETVTVTNNDEKTIAVKIKTSDIRFLRVNPVWSFIEKGKTGSLSVMRLPGPVLCARMDVVMAQTDGKHKTPRDAIDATPDQERYRLSVRVIAIDTKPAIGKKDDDNVNMNPDESVRKKKKKARRANDEKDDEAGMSTKIVKKRGVPQSPRRPKVVQEKKEKEKEQKKEEEKKEDEKKEQKKEEEKKEEKKE